MPIDASSLLFFDASCLIAAAGSPTVGSSLQLSACAHGLLRGAISKPVLIEAKANILRKFRPIVWDRYEHEILRLPLLIAEIRYSEETRLTASIAGEKDAHVLAAALSIHAPYLITHDQRLAARVNQAELPTLALTPGEFIQLARLQDPGYFSTLSSERERG